MPLYKFLNLTINHKIKSIQIQNKKSSKSKSIDMLLISLLRYPLGNEHHQQNETASSQHQKRNPQKQVPVSHIICFSNENAFFPERCVKG
jgi:hypothetical protein